MSNNMTETTEDKHERVRGDIQQSVERFIEQGETEAARIAAAQLERMDQLSGKGQDDIVASTFSLSRVSRDIDPRVVEWTEKKIRYQLGAFTTNQKRAAHSERVTEELQLLAEDYWREDAALTKFEVANLLLVDHREACKKGEDEEGKAAFYSPKYISGLIQKPA